MRSRSGWRSLRIHLIELIIGGDGMPAQAWRAEVVVRSKVIGQVVLKLIVDELRPIFDFELPIDKGDAAIRETAELRAYERMQHLQGRAIPHFYGAPRFTMPWGNEVTGLLLEDLKPVSEPLHVFCERNVDVLQSAKEIDPLARACFDYVHRAQEAGIARLELRVTDLVVLNSSSPERPVVVGFDFASTMAAEEFEADWKSTSDAERAEEPWQSRDEGDMVNALRRAVGLAVSRWIRDLAETDPKYLYWLELQ
ncbi:hypothetical protein JCM10908_000939 [Rhodotorula pacifica]|uniref:uncharacterized protein n=1 Tax=Rhodotorula pacifica TaxID=1495444 RepID=UPI0031721F45